MGKHSKFKWKIGWTRKVHPRIAKARLLQDSYTIYTYTPHISFPPKRKSKKKLSNPISSKLPSKNLNERKIHNSSSRAPKITKFGPKLPHIMGKLRSKFHGHPISVTCSNPCSKLRVNSNYENY